MTEMMRVTEMKRVTKILKTSDYSHLTFVFYKILRHSHDHLLLQCCH